MQRLIRYLIYLCPPMANITVGSVFFITVLRMKQSGASPEKCSALITTWMIFYTATAFLLSRINTPSRSPYFIISSGFVILLSSLGFVMFPDVNWQFFWIALNGIATALFFIPFQVFMKTIVGASSHSLRFSAGIYTACCSLGMALGPLINGFVWAKWDWQECQFINAVLGVLLAIIILTVKKRQRLLPETENNNSADTQCAHRQMPNIIFAAWMLCVIGQLAVVFVRTLFPLKAYSVGISKPDQGIVLALINVAQAIVSLALCCSRYWMYRITAITLLTIPGIVGLLILGAGQTAVFLMVGAVICGIYSGYLLFYQVFISLADMEKSVRYTAISEGIKGVTGIAAPLLGGMIISNFGNDASYYIMAALPTLAFIFQIGLYRHHKIPDKLRAIRSSQI